MSRKAKSARSSVMPGALVPPESRENVHAALPAAKQVRAAQKVRGSARAKSPRSHRELAQAIFEQCDPITVGRELLEAGSERSSSVKARVWETLVEFLLGKPAPAGGASNAGVRIVWDLPAPPHETPER